ncbi:DUF4421 domain-containing protein [Foetidibacter luteolus]|uniref:DUF4421 domain-containing protein n=1 Tax=Foetidibacter luteolus TaxID=2608880 RepID=UPI001A97FBE8|nr:DUF4421 domain-containing protein [Foetidibacter luteolus]
MLLLLTGIVTTVNGQYRKDTVKNQPQKAHSNPIQTFDDKITTRVFIGDRINSLRINGSGERGYFRYSPNTNWNMGAGVTYRAITLNLGLGLFGRDADKGTTRFFDLQSNIYTRNWTIDAIWQTYKGFYIREKGIVPGTAYYTNPDLRVTVVGGGIWRIFNGENFSYRAAMTQNEWQKKSAGSVLAGFTAYYGSVNAAGLLIPEGMPSTIPQNCVTGIHFFKAGPGVSYAYTYVYDEHFFATGGLATTLEVGTAREFTDTATLDKFNIAPNATFRLAAGYNSEKWNIQLALVNSSVAIHGQSEALSYRITSGNFRLTLARRFTPNPKTKELLKPVDDKLNEMEQ